MGFAALAPIIASVAGAGLSALGGRKGPKTETQQQQDTTSTENYSQSQEQSQQYNGATLPFEDPLSYLFRAGLYGQVGNELQRVQKPIYGDAEKSSFLGSLNGLADDATKSLRGRLAAIGASDSGRAGEAATDIERTKFGKYSDFLSSLPALEENARRGSTAQLLGIGNQLAGIAPVGQFQSGSSQGSASSQGQSQKETHSTGSATQTGPSQSFGAGFASNLGGFGGLIGGQTMPGLIDWLNKRGIKAPGGSQALGV